jgi:L-threonylcarbamoyladenylate synthase
MSIVYNVQRNKLDEIILKRVKEVLDHDGLIAYPTETVYGLGANLTVHAINKLISIKQRTESKYFSMLISNPAMVNDFIEGINKNAKILINRFWPGPLTLIMKLKKNLSSPLKQIGSSDNKIGIRCSSHQIARQIVEYYKSPIISTSANISGQSPSTNVNDIKRYFKGEIELILNDGESLSLLPSTIIDVTGPEIKILREGDLKKEEILKAIRR